MSSTVQRPPVFRARGHGVAGPAAEIHYFDAAHPRVRVGVHTHTDLEVLYFSTAAGSHQVGSRRWPVQGGEIFVVPPGVPHDLSDMGDESGWAVEFSPDALVSSAGESLLTWWANPLLSAFVASEHHPGASRISVPEHRRGPWEALLTGMQREAEERLGGYELALASYLSLVVVSVARLAGDFTGQLRLQDQPLLAGCFETIERRFREHLRPRDVAASLSVTPGHLTTTVKDRTGRSVGEWITERRMAEARLLLRSTDMPADAIAPRVGFADPAYFNRRFRQTHGVPPGAWRSRQR